nr:ankyrin repeat domain-containing protein 61-like [Procambarus clarkii]
MEIELFCNNLLLFLQMRMGGKTVLLVVAALTVHILHAHADINADAQAVVTAMSTTDASVAVELIKKNPALALRTESSTSLTLLVYACQLGIPSVVQTLVDFGANIEVRLPNILTTPLEVAVYESCCIDCINTLIKAGSNVNVQDVRGLTALMYGADGACESAVPLLMEAGANINLADIHGLTVVMQMKQYGSSVLSVLLAYCPDLTLTDKMGEFSFCLFNTRLEGVPGWAQLFLSLSLPRPPPSSPLFPPSPILSENFLL